jgi:hypothetical protein
MNFEGVPEGRRRVHGPRRPWPRLAVPGQEGKGPTVTDIPIKMELDFQRAIGLRLVKDILIGTAAPFVWSRRHPCPDALDDAKILDLLFGTIFCRFLTFTLDPADEATFAAFLAERQEGETDFKVDFSAMNRIHALPGIYVAPTVTLGRIAADGTKRLIAMKINGLVLTPADTNAWALARYFFMQGAGLHGVLCHHTPLHFQYDAINALTTSLLPETHTLRKLLEPHFAYTLSLNRAALHSSASILTNKPYLAYATFPGDAASTHHFQASGWSGIDGNSAYPAYRFAQKPPALHGDLGIFLDAYYRVIRSFVARVTDTIAADDPHVQVWAGEIAKWLPGFPDADEIKAPDRLTDVAAYIVWGTSVAHSTEHCGLVDDIPLGAIPLRLRVMPPFSKDTPPLDRRALTRPGDMFRQRVAWEILVRDVAATRLDNTDYGFAASELKQANAEFLAALKAVDADLPVRRFIPLKRIARGIQF